MRSILIWATLIFICSCDMDFYGAPGSGLGTLASIEHKTYNHKYIIKYADTLVSKEPQYQIPDSLSHIDMGYDFLNLQPFYFESFPREILYIQWEGTGFIEIRMAYDLENNKKIIQNSRHNKLVPDSTKNRMKNRFVNEILIKIDSLISISDHKDSAKYLPPLERADDYY